MLSRSNDNKLSQLIAKGGGKYRNNDGHDGIMFNVYTNVAFSPPIAEFRGISTGISFDAPPGRARSTDSRQRAMFWEGASGKRLMQGGLIALVWGNGHQVDIHLGTLSSSLKDISSAAKSSADRVNARVVFFDPQVELRILQTFKKAERRSSIVLVEVPVMYEAVRPFLQALRVAPETLPFGRYLAHHPISFFAPPFKIDPPQYATVPGFQYNLGCLFDAEADLEDLRLNVGDPASISIARQQLKERSRLDPSQAESVVDCLTREVSLIQG